MFRLQETCPLTPKKVKQDPRRAEIEKELEVASGSDCQPDSGSEFPPRITAERESVEPVDGGYEEEQEEETPFRSSEDNTGLRREMIELPREMKDMRKEFRKGLEKILYVRRHQPDKGEIDTINLEDGE